MKRILYFFSVMLCILAVTGCQDRDIIDFKDGVSLPPVTDLKSSLTPDNDAVLEWKLRKRYNVLYPFMFRFTKGRCWSIRFLWKVNLLRGNIH